MPPDGSRLSAALATGPSKKTPCCALRLNFWRQRFHSPHFSPGRWIHYERPLYRGTSDPLFERIQRQLGKPG